MSHKQMNQYLAVCGGDSRKAMTLYILIIFFAEKLGWFAKHFVYLQRICKSLRL